MKTRHDLSIINCYFMISPGNAFSCKELPKINEVKQETVVYINNSSVMIVHTVVRVCYRILLHFINGS